MPSVGQCTICLDVGSTTEILAAPQSIASTSLELLDRLVALQLPATWALNDFAVALVGDRVATTPGQEIALLANRHEFETDGRALAKSLAIHVAARSTSTIVGDGWTDAASLEAAARVRVTAVRVRQAPQTSGWFGGWRSTPSTTGKSLSTKSSELRWGLRQFSPTLALPEARRSALHRALALAAAGASIVVVIDVVGLASSPRASLLATAALDQLAGNRDDGAIELLNLRDLVTKLDDANRGRPTRSILRASA